MIYLDLETTSLSGMPVILQYAEDDGPVEIFEIWTRPIQDTLDLIENFVNHEDGLCFFNAVFDFFMLCKIYTTLYLYPDKSAIPEHHIAELAILEKQARDGPCLKPKKVIDIMLHARKGPYQSLMDRNDIRIKKVPNALALPLSIELEKRVRLKDIYFAKRKNKYEPQWKIFEIEDEPDFKDIVLKFRASSGLKALAVDALNIKDDDLLLYGDISLEKEDFSQELGYAPFALAIGNPRNWNGTWPDRIHVHIHHWATNKLARKYAKDDVLYTRGLYKHFGCPETNDDDSVLACAVAASRWRGFNVNIEKLKILKNEAIQKAKSVPTAPAAVKRYVLDLLDETERIVIEDNSTKKSVLETISEFTIDCPDCEKDSQFLETFIGECRNPNCKNGHIPHPAAIRAQQVIEAREAQYQINIYDKLLQAERFHADFNIIGTLSSRMSGSSGINAQGIQATKEVRSCFPLAFPGDILCIGDFESFEVTLADAAYNDPRLREDLLKGKSVHAIFGSFVYAPMTYEQILASKGTKDDKYKVSKNCLFSMLYGGTSYTIETKYGVSKENAEKGYELFLNNYPTVAKIRNEIQDRFRSMTQEYIHGKVEWKDPEEKIESLFGFPRYYTLENQICRALFNLAEKPPKEWTSLKLKVTRRDREQTVSGAIRSALFAAAFTIQGSNQRSATNHLIQSTGATITKGLQRRIWNLQPSGITEWQVQTLNVHDEIATISKPNMVDKVKDTVQLYVEEIRNKVPLLNIEWKTYLKSWGEK